jgi:ferredoxin
MAARNVNTDGWLSPIFDTINTTLMGLIVTFRTWALDPKQTIQYPDVDVRTGKHVENQKMLFGVLPMSLKALPSMLYGDLPMGKDIGYDGRLSSKIADRFRGILNVDIEICTACLACSRACPIDCIQIDSTKVGKELKLERFDIDIALCMYCGLCSAPCPTGAIHHTKEFEASTTDFPDLIRRFVDEPRMAYRAKKLKEPLGTEAPPAPADAAPAAGTLPEASKA